MARNGDKQSEGVLAFFLLIFRFVRLFMSGQQAIVIENAALRLQLAAFQRQRKRPVLASLDRLFWIILRRLWSGWHGPLLYVQPNTVVRWQRERFRRFWRDYQTRIALLEAGPRWPPRSAA